MQIGGGQSEMLWSIKNSLRIRSLRWIFECCLVSGHGVYTAAKAKMCLFLYFGGAINVDGSTLPSTNVQNMQNGF